MKSARWMVAPAVGLWMLGTGCVSLDEHRQLQMAHRSLEAEKAQLEAELYDSRSGSGGMRTKLEAAEQRLADREALVANLQSENDRLHAAFNKAQTALGAMAAKNIVNDPILIETKLPAQLDSALKQFASQFPSSVEYDAKRGIVKWKSDLLFALGSDVVMDSAVESLQGFAEIIASSAAQGFDVLIVGHTDDRPVVRPETRQQHPTNWHLSTHRSIAVSNVLQKSGLTPARIGVMGFGEYRPIGSNSSDSGRSQNRRVEIYVVPAGSIGGAVSPAVASGAPRMQTMSSSSSDAGIK